MTPDRYTRTQYDAEDYHAHHTLRDYPLVHVPDDLAEDIVGCDWCDNPDYVGHLCPSCRDYIHMMRGEH